MRKRPPYETEFSEEFWFGGQGSRSLSHRDRFTGHPERQMVKRSKTGKNTRDSEQSQDNKS